MSPLAGHDYPRSYAQLRAWFDGDGRRVLVGFDRAVQGAGEWSQSLFAHMEANGFDVLTWHKRTTDDVAESLFIPVTHTDEYGETHTFTAADTLSHLPVATTKTTGKLFTIRQISQIVPNTTGGGTRQIHILTTDRALPAGEAIYRLGNRWRQENYFRYARLHFDPDSHHAYTSSAEDPERTEPNPAKTRAYQKVLAARKHFADTAADTDAALLALRTPPAGTSEIMVTSAMVNAIKAPLWDAEAILDSAETAHRALPAKVRLGDLAPGQQVLDTETKLITHAIRMAALNTMMTLAREIRTNTGRKRTGDDAHALLRTALGASGDIDPTVPGLLTITLDPLPTKRATKAIAELCEHLTSTQTRYPGTEQIIRYKIRNHA